MGIKLLPIVTFKQGKRTPSKYCYPIRQFPPTGGVQSEIYEVHYDLHQFECAVGWKSFKFFGNFC